jgi:hypothetical protein
VAPTYPENQDWRNHCWMNLNLGRLHCPRPAGQFLGGNSDDPSRMQVSHHYPAVTRAVVNNLSPT